ncbi:NAD+ kinase [Synchytrium endobioticum]|uniref:NAD+ kinase n=1 Tax=Synchytrium endobioticum TaxID=286115 RepID=A0A507D4D3_9FUNG|nr:NAD+ kinase [Synchytrium endobioticum]TPX46342.1 NAD+ kinase [Synchytrium endobioticum]
MSALPACSAAIDTEGPPQSLELKLSHGGRIVCSILNESLSYHAIAHAFATSFQDFDPLSASLEFLDDEGDWCEIKDDAHVLKIMARQARAKNNRLSIRNSSWDCVNAASAEGVSAVSAIAEASVKLLDMTTKLSKLRLVLSSIRNILVVTKPFDPSLVPLTRDLAVWLVETYPTVNVFVQEPLRSADGFDYDSLKENSPAVRDRLKFWGREFIKTRADDVSLAITLGGDGTVLYTSWLFQKQSPPVMPFFLGSLGFLTVFDFAKHRQTLSNVFEGQAQRANLRMRLQCSVYSKPRSPNSLNTETRQMAAIPRGALPKHTIWTRDAVIRTEDSCDESDTRPCGLPNSVHQIMNEVVVDRGASPNMLQLELYADNLHLTTFLADGLVIGTPTGSTAYNLSAGGSLVHPDKASILVTPICPHTLTCRPMILPGQSELRICVTSGTRSVAWASFDGRNRRELLPGDSITITASRYPFVTLCHDDQTSDWFRSLISTLHWNERVAQKPFDRNAMM